MLNEQQKKYAYLGTAVALLLGAFLFGKYVPFYTSNTTTEGAAFAQGEVARILPQRSDDLIWGNQTDTPIVQIVEYGSLTCPHCAIFHTTIAEKLKQTYADNKDVQMIYRHYPIDKVALKASLIARCDPKKEQAFVNMFYNQQQQWLAGTEGDIVNNLKTYAKMGGLSEEQAEKCSASQEAALKLAENKQYANQNFNIEATPTILINGRKHIGEQKLAEIQQEIEALLAKASKPETKPVEKSEAKNDAVQTTEINKDTLTQQ